MADIFEIAGRIHSTSQEKVAVVADEVLDANKNKKQSQINSETDVTLANHTSAIQGLNSQNYVTETATDQTTDVTDVLPATGSADTIYRVGSWDGTQYDETCYSEYSWNGSAYVHIDTKTQIGEVFDISAYHASGGTLAKYADLSAALDFNNGGGVPQSLQKGGMSIKFVQSSDNNYIQARLMANAFTTDITKWQVVEDVPTAGSNNLVKSGGVIDFSNTRITKLVGIFSNGSVYAPNWKVGDIMFNTSTQLLRKCLTITSGDATSFETVPFNNDVIYSWNNTLWKWNGNRIIPLSKIIPLVSITDDSSVTEIGQFWYSSTDKAIRMCVKVEGGKAHYVYGTILDSLFLWNGNYYKQNTTDGLIQFASLSDVNSAKSEAKTYADNQLNKSIINLVFMGTNGSDYAPNWHVGDIMYNLSTKKIRKCESVDGQGDASSFSTIEPIEDTVLAYQRMNFVIDANDTNGIKCVSHIIPVKSITTSDPINIGEFYLSSTSNVLRIKVSATQAITISTFDDAIYLFEDKLYRVLNNNIIPVSGGGNIFTSSYNSVPATTQIAKSTINTSKKINVGDLLIANPAYSYLYKITAVDDTNVTVSYYSTLKGNDGQNGNQGAQGNSGYSGAAEELEVVNNLEDGGATAALSAEQGKILGNWKTFNSEPLILQKKNPKSLMIIDLDNWSTDAKGTIGNISKVYDEVRQEYADVRLLTSNNSGSGPDGAVFKKQLPQSINMSTNVLRGAIYQDLEYTPINVKNMNISLYSGGVIDNAHRAYCSLCYNGDNPYYCRTGWFHFCLNIPLQSYVYADTLGASFDPTNVTHIAFNVNHAAGTTLNLAITGFDVVPCLSKPGIVTIVDNFNPNVPEMAEYAASKGVRLNISIIPKWIQDGDSRTGTLDQVYAAAKQGHFIFNHTWNHQIYGGQPTLEVFEQINKADRWMIERGLSRGSKVLSNPSAAFDNDKYKAYFASQAALVYHHWTTFFNPMTLNNKTKCILYYPYKGMERTLNISLLDSYFTQDFSLLTPAAVLGGQAAINYGGILVCGFHGVKYGTEGYITDMSIWEDYIDAISELNLYHYTIDELLEGAYM